MRPPLGSSKKIQSWLVVAILGVGTFLSRDECSLAHAFVGHTSTHSGWARPFSLSRVVSSSTLRSVDERLVGKGDRLTPLNDGFSVDPLIYSVLEDRESSSLELLGGILEASDGIRVWRHALTKGRLPLESEFPATTTGGIAWWPRQPLFSKLYDSMVALQLPRFTLRHPEAITLVLLSLLRLTIEYSKQLRSVREEKDVENLEDGQVEEEEDFYFLEWQKQFQNDFDTQSTEASQLETVDDEATLADETARGLLEEWIGVLNGVNILDSLFGFDHGLLQVSQDASEDSGGGATMGFGVHDGIWSHTGWKEIPKLQQELSNVSELKELVQSLGRRPSAKDSDRIQKFAPRNQQKDGALGAEFDPQLRESVEGISHSGSFSEMLPSEALLLCGESKALRRLFLAKKSGIKVAQLSTIRLE